MSSLESSPTQQVIPQLKSSSPTSTSVTFTSTNNQPPQTTVSTTIDESTTKQPLLVSTTTKKSVLINTTNNVTISNHDQQQHDHENRIQTLKRKFSMNSSSVKTSKTKTTATSSKSSTLLNVKLCCGTFAFNCLKITSILGMFIIIASFLTIFITTILTFEIVKWPLVETLEHYGNSYKFYNSMIMAEYIAVFGRNESYAVEYYQAKKSLIGTLNNLFALVPTASMTNLTRDANDIPLFKLQEQVVELVVAQNYSAALTNFYKPEHYNGMFSFLNTYVNFVGEIKNMSTAQEKAMEASITTDMTVIGVCLSVAIPLVLLIFINAIKVEHDSAKKLEHAKAIMVIQTIADPFLRPLFREYCQGGFGLNSFQFIEQVQLFKEHKKSLHSTIRSILEDMKQFSTNHMNERDVQSANMNSPPTSTSGMEEDEQSEVLTFTSDLLSSRSVKSNDPEDKRASDIYNQFLDGKLAPNFVKYPKHLEIKKEIEQFQSKLQQQANQGGGNNKEEETDNDKLCNVFDQAQIYIGKKLIKAHETFKNSVHFPNLSKADMLDSFRVDYLNLVKKVEQSNRKSFKYMK